MGQRLESSAERRLQTFRQSLAVDLFTRHDPFWDRVDEVRRGWLLEVVSRVPPALDIDHAHLPPLFYEEVWGTRAVPEHPDFIRRSILLGQLRAEFVPETHHVDGASFRSEDVCHGFLSGCLLYDPPAGDLLAYADAPVAAYGDFFNRISHHEHVDPPDVWSARLAAVGLDVTEHAYYFSPSAHRVFDVAHYIGVPSLISKRLTGKWVIHPVQARLLERWYRRHYEEPFPDEGAYQFVRCVKRA